MSSTDDQLQRLLTLAAPHPAGVEFDDVRRGARRRRRRSTAALASGVAVIAAVATAVVVSVRHDAGPVAHLGPAMGTSIDLTGTVPWIDAPPAPYEAPPTPGTAPPTSDARPCAAADVTARANGQNGAAGTLLHYLVFRNVSTSTCVLKGYPTVVAEQTGLQDVTASRGGIFDGVESTANMAPGGTTLLALETHGSCATGSPGTPATYRRVAVSLPGGGTKQVPVPEGLELSCGLSVDRFWVNSPPAASPVDPLSHLTVALEVPRTVRPGTTLVYVADVTNPTSEPVSLTRCPGYLEELTRGTTALVKLAYGLNCAAVRAIPAKGTVRFAMRLEVPGDAYGTLALTWSWSWPLGQGASAGLTVAGSAHTTYVDATGTVHLVFGVTGTKSLPAHATVTFTGAAGSFDATTTADGSYVIELPPGTYTAAATTADFGSPTCATVSGVTVGVSAAPIDITCRVP